MGLEAGSQKQFFAADISTIASTADSSLSGAQSLSPYCRKVWMQLIFTSHASGSGSVTATVYASIDGVNYEVTGNNIVHTIVAGAANKSNVLVFPDVGGVSAFKVKIHNSDPAQAITLANVVMTEY